MSETQTIGRDDATETREIDFLVKCNSCGFIQPKSCPAGCPGGHEVGWSYAGPIPGDEPEPDGDIEADLKAHFEGIDRHEAIIRDTFASLLAIGHSEQTARELIGVALHAGRKFDSVAEMVDAIYLQGREGTPPEDADDEEPEAEPGADEEGDEAAAESPEMTKLIDAMFAAQDRLDEAIGEAADRAEASKIAKKRVETRQEDLSLAVRRVREARSASEPDPDRYPLLDGPRPEAAAKAEVDASFPRPEAVAPLPADTFEEHARRLGIRTRIDALGLPPKLDEVLADAGVHTIDQWGRKRAAVEEGGASVTTIRGLTEARLEKLVAAIDREMRAWAEAWDEAHPDRPAGAGAAGESEAADA